MPLNDLGADLLYEITIFLGEKDLLLTIEPLSKLWKHLAERRWQAYAEIPEIKCLTYKHRDDMTKKEYIARAMNSEVGRKNENMRPSCFVILGASFNSYSYATITFQADSDKGVYNKTVDSILQFHNINNDDLHEPGVDANVGACASVLDKNGKIFLFGGWNDNDEEVMNYIFGIDMKTYRTHFFLDNIQHSVTSKELIHLPHPLCYSSATTRIQGDIILTGGGRQSLHTCKCV